MDETPISRSELWRTRLRKLRAGIRKTVPFITGMVAAFAAIWLYSFVFPPPRPLTTRQVSDTVNSVLASATPQPAYSEQVYQIIRPSLILIQTKTGTTNGKDEGGLGSGVIINDAGDILTCLHVIAGATQIQVTYADGTQSTAQAITRTPANDTAILRADKPPAQIFPATLGNLGAMQVGDEAYAVGNPFGLYASMSAGVISGFDRAFAPQNSDAKLQGLIQIDTAVNPGNSGGPLLNRYGQVIGIVEGIANPTGQDVFIGIGFAVPITGSGGALGSPID